MKALLSLNNGISPSAFFDRAHIGCVAEREEIFPEQLELAIVFGAHIGRRIDRVAEIAFKLRRRIVDDEHPIEAPAETLHLVERLEVAKFLAILRHEAVAPFIGATDRATAIPAELESRSEEQTSELQSLMRT